MPVCYIKKCSARKKENQPQLSVHRMWCRLCLAINENMTPMGDMELKLFVEKIFKLYGFNMNIEEHNFVCWGCKALLKKSFNFFQRVFKAQHELLNIMWTHKTVNLQLLNTVHRQELNFDMNLSFKKTSVDYFFIHNKDIKVKFIDDNRQNVKPSTSYEFDVQVKTEKTDEAIEQNTIDSAVNKISVQHFENVDDMGSIPNVTVKNNVWSDTEQLVSDEDECYISPGVVKPSEHSSGACSVEDPFNELAKTETKDIVETNSSVPVDFDPKKVNLLSDIEFTKMIKRRNTKSTRVDYKSLLPSSSDSENSGSDKKKIRKNLIRGRSSSDNENSGSDKKKIKKNPTRGRPRGRRRRSEDEDFVPEKAPAVTTSESSEDCFDDEGKRIKRPKDRRVYPMQCEQCEAEIFEKKVHYRHYLIYHPDIEYPYMLPKQFLCQYCGKGYRQNTTRTQHEQTHKGERTFQCPICPKKFLNSTQMVNHKYNVHGGDKYICDYCGRSTKTRGAFVFHIRSHTGEKPYNCHICNAAFSHHAYRISHIKHAHGQNGRQTNTTQPKALELGKTKGEGTKRGRKKGSTKNDGGSKRKEKKITKKRDKKKGNNKKGTKQKPDADVDKVTPTEQENVKETAARERMDSASSEDEILASISNRKGPRQEV